jgi:acetyl esterase/lipase
MVSKKLPSYERDPYFSGCKDGLRYMGYEDPTKEMLAVFDTYEHTLLLDEQTRAAFQARLNVNLIQETDQIKDAIFKKYKTMNRSSLSMTGRVLNESSILAKNKKLARDVFNLFSDEVSPSLVNDETLGQYPATYMAICDRDPLRDEALIFVERMKRLDVNVVKDIYSCFHGDQSLRQNLLQNKRFFSFLETELNLKYN